MKKRRIGKGMLRASRIAADNWGQRSYINVFLLLCLWVAFNPLAGQPHHHMPSLPTMWAKTCTWEGFCAVPLADSIWVPKHFRKCNLGTRQGFGCLVWIASLTPSQAVLKLSDVHHADVTAKEWVYGSKNLGHSMFMSLNLFHSYVPNIPATSLYGIILRRQSSWINMKYKETA